MKDRMVIEDPGPEDGFEGMYLGTPDINVTPSKPLDFDLHAAAHYMREHNLKELTDEIKEMFAYK